MKLPMRPVSRPTGISGAAKSPKHAKLRLRERAPGSHAVLDRNRAARVLAERSVDQSFLLLDRAVDDRPILFDHVAAFPNPANFERRFGILRYEGDAAGFAVEPVD